MCVFIHTYIYVCICVYVYMHMYIRVHVYVFTYTHMYTYVYIYTHIYIHVYVHMHIYKYIKVYVEWGSGFDASPLRRPWQAETPPQSPYAGDMSYFGCFGVRRFFFYTCWIKPGRL